MLRLCLLLIACTALVCVSSLPAAGEPLPLSDVAGIVAQLSEPYKHNQAKVMQVMEEVSDLMLNFLEDVAAKLNRVHQALSGALSGGVEKISNGRSVMSQVEAEADAILAGLGELRQSCTSGMYQLGGQRPAAIPEQEPHHSSEVTDESHEEEQNWDDLLMMSQAELAALINPSTGGHDEVVAEVMGQHGEGAYVMLEDVLTVMQQLGKHLEKETLAGLPGRMAKVKAAFNLLAQISGHTTQISHSVAVLRAVADQTDYAAIERVGEKMERIAVVLEDVQCVQ